MPIRPPKWWKLFELLSENWVGHYDNEELANMVDTIWFFFGKKL